MKELFMKKIDRRMQEPIMLIDHDKNRIYTERGKDNPYGIFNQLKKDEIIIVRYVYRDGVNDKRYFKIVDLKYHVTEDGEIVPVVEIEKVNVEVVE